MPTIRHPICLTLAAVILVFGLSLGSSQAAPTKGTTEPPARFGTLSAGIAVEKNYEKPKPPGKPRPVEPPPKAEEPKPTIDDLLTQLLATSDLPARRKNRLLAMAGAAYSKNGYLPLWGSDNPDIVLERLSDTLKSHAVDPFAIPQLVPEKATEWPQTGLPVDDARLTLQTAEACLLIDEGPATRELIWPAWNEGDTPGTIDTATHTKNVSGAFAERMQQRDNEPETVLRAFAPSNWIYQRLRSAWIGSEVYPNPEPLPYSGLLRTGTNSEQVRTFAVALKLRGYLDADALKEIGTTVTPAMGEAIRTFQRDNGLTTDGILGPKTLAKINRDPLRDRQILVLNLHRARLLPNDLGQRYAIANLPAGELIAVDGNTVKQHMRIVFGRNQTGRRSPMFRDTIEQVIFRPFWWVPTSIAKNELLPKGYSYLARNGYQIISSKGNVVSLSSSNLARVRAGTCTLRQRSGRNALGQVKFRFPNHHAVYFHDTPQKHLFKYSNRDHSHGCIRLENPIGFAQYVLEKDPEWSPEKISRAVRYGDRTIVPLKDPVHVFITYFTAFPAIGAGNGIRYYDDVYGRDMASLGTLVTASDRQ